MSKVDVNIVNNIKMLSVEMVGEAGSGDAKFSLSTAEAFYALFKYHLNFQSNNKNFINRDRVIVSNRYLPIMYSTLHIFGYDISLDSLKEYKKLNSNIFGFANPNTNGIEVGSISSGDVIASSVGITLGERYIESLIKKDYPKCDLINFHTYCFCTMDDLMSGISYESLSFAGKENLNKLVILCNIDDIGKDSSNVETYCENIKERFMSIDFSFIEVKNGHNIGDMEDAIDEAKESKKPTIILFRTKYGKDSLYEGQNERFNLPLTSDDISNLQEKYKIILPINNTENIRLEVQKLIDKRLNKMYNKWNEIYNEYKNNKNIKEIIEFLETKKLDIHFSSEKLKLNDNYNEELHLGNGKMFNVFASKSPYILSCSNDNFIYTKTNILKSNIMDKENMLGRNILFGNRNLAMGGIACGLASIGFKVFVSMPLTESVSIINSIKLSSIFNYPVNYIFTQDSFINNYENLGLNATIEMNILRMMPEVLTFRPCDIYEVMGIYEILANYKKSSVIIVGGEKTPKLSGTNPKYVMGGAYRIRREKEKLDGTIIATGSEISLALDIAKELYANDIDLRVVSMPSYELFQMQTDKYKNSLVPKEVDTFVIEFGDKTIWNKYATSDEHIFGINKFGTSGTKEELLSYYNLTKDNIKTKIIEIIKNKNIDKM